MKVIEIKDFTKNYGKARGVIDLNLEVEEGDIFGFMGQNGAGKSTTIRTLLGLISATEGTIKIFGKDIKENQVEVLKKIGYMPSEAMFYPNMRVEEIVKLSADMRGINCSEEAEKLYDRLQVDKRKKISELSLGNRKKVSIICAMQHKPELYIFDEPTSGLDPLMQKEFFNLILERNKEGATVFLSSRVLSEIQNYCKNVAIIREGKLIAVDSVESLAKTTLRKVKIIGSNKIDNLKGTMNVQATEKEISFLYNGEMKKLINEINKLDIEDVVIEEPSLEEIFMHFYEKEGK